MVLHRNDSYRFLLPGRRTGTMTTLESGPIRDHLSLVATVDTASLRDELARLKGEYDTLAAAGKVPEETWVLMGTAFVLLEPMVAIV